MVMAIPEKGLRLHLACRQESPSLKMIQEIVQAAPHSVECRSQEDRWLPLHRICRQRDPSLDVVRTLVQAWPASVREWTEDHHYHHHHAQQHGNDDDDHIVGQEARLPIHLACQFGSSLAVVQYLVEQDPTCLQAVSPKKMYTALDFALYYFHQRRRQGLDVSEAERVINYLASVRVSQLDREDGKKEVEDEVRKESDVPTVRAQPIVIASTAARKPSLKISAPSFPKPVYAQARPRRIVPPPVVSKSASGSLSKIIRIKLPRPTAPLR